MAFVIPSLIMYHYNAINVIGLDLHITGKEPLQPGMPQNEQQTSFLSADRACPWVVVAPSTVIGEWR